MFKKTVFFSNHNYIHTINKYYTLLYITYLLLLLGILELHRVHLEIYNHKVHIGTYYLCL